MTGITRNPAWRCTMSVAVLGLVLAFIMELRRGAFLKLLWRPQ